MESSLIEAIATGGPVAILAFVIFLMYRRDRKASEDRIRCDRIYMEDRLTSILERESQSRDAQTAALVGLTSILRLIAAKNGIPT